MARSPSCFFVESIDRKFFCCDIFIFRICVVINVITGRWVDREADRLLEAKGIKLNTENIDTRDRQRRQAANREG